MKVRNEIPEARWSKGSNIIETFAVELEEFTQTGTVPAHAGQDIGWSLVQQKKRLDALDLDLDYEFIPRGHFGQSQGATKEWSDGHYISRMGYRSCRFCRTISRNGRKLMKQERNVLLYQTITDVHNWLAAKADTHTCPSCGAIGTLESLVDGCDYCGTHFKMTDLFPKITGYFYLDDYGRTSEELKGEIGKFVIPPILICTAFFTYGYMQESTFILALIPGVLAGGLMGGIFGYLLWAFRTLRKLFKDAGRASKVLIKVGSSEKRFVKAMQRYSPEFSYTYFSDAVVNLLKTVLYSDDPEALPIYEGGRLPQELSNIVDSVQFGSVALKRFQVQGGICYITADVHMENLYLRGSSIRKKDDVFRLQLKRDVSKPVDLHFSIHHLRCKNCAASFDALRHKNCPSCGSRYGTEDLEWIITDLRKK